MYGHQFVKEMEIRSSGYFHLKESTLCPALHRLECDGLVEGTWEDSPTGPEPSVLSHHRRGRGKLLSMLQEWDLFTRAVNLVAKPVSDLAKGVLKSR